MFRSIKQLLFRRKPRFVPGDAVEFVVGDMLCPPGTKLVVAFSRYYPFGYSGNFFHSRPAEYRYALNLWDSRLFVDVREHQIEKRDD